MVELRIFRGEDCPGLSKWVLSNHKVFTKGSQETRETQTLQPASKGTVSPEVPRREQTLIEASRG